MQFTLTGFAQESGFRVFTFERIAEDHSRTKCTVKADLALVRKFMIPIQELPLLCRSVLERLHNGAEVPALTFTEEDMSRYATDRSASRVAAAARRKPPRRPPSANQGNAWRVPQR